MKAWMKTGGILACLFFCICTYATGQVAYTQFPLDLQLYGRNLVTNRADIPFEGKVAATSLFTELRLKKYRNAVLQNMFTIPLVYGIDSASFSLTDNILTELANYKYELYGYLSSTSTEVLLNSADSVVSGDVYIIEGQSNAEAKMYNGSASENNSPYIRVYGNGSQTGVYAEQWFVGQGDGDRATNGNIGQWGLRAASRIIAEYGFPIAVFNGAMPGQALVYFQKNTAPITNNNYSRLLDRIKKARLNHKIRAFFWHQGESNAPSFTSTAGYKAAFKRYHDSLKLDYPSIERFYIFQIRLACYDSTTYFRAILNLQQAQKELGDTEPDMTTISTNNTQQNTDSCHFMYDKGYKEMGDRLYEQLRVYQYGAVVGNNIESPKPLSAVVTATNKITLTLKNAADTYTLTSNFMKDILLEGGTYSITSLSMTGNKLIINFALTGATTTPPTLLTVASHKFNPTPSLYNANGMGIMSVYRMPVTMGLLPLSNIGFNVILQNGHAQLNWNAPASENFVVFEVERSLDGLIFTKLADIVANNYSALPAYTHTAASLVQQQTYFRIKAKKADSSFVYSEIRYLNNNQLQQTLQLVSCPNPFLQVLNIEVTSAITSNVSISIYSAAGHLQQRLQQTINKGVAHFIMATSQLPMGVYILELNNGSTVVRRKINKLSAAGL
jgi:hypothetical protein